MAVQIVETIVEALTTFVVGSASATVDAFNAIAITTNAEGVTQLTDFAIWALVFTAIGVATAVIVGVKKKVG